MFYSGLCHRHFVNRMDAIFWDLCSLLLKHEIPKKLVTFMYWLLLYWPLRSNWITGIRFIISIHSGFASRSYFFFSLSLSLSDQMQNLITNILIISCQIFVVIILFLIFWFLWFGDENFAFFILPHANYFLREFRFCESFFWRFFRTLF